MVSGAGPPDGEILEVVDLTQDQPPSMRGVDSDLVDLSQLSSGDEEESFRPPPSLTETKALYRGGTGISRLLEVERDLRDRLLQCQEPIATTAKAAGATAVGATAVGATAVGATAERSRPAPTVSKSSSTAASKDEAAALRKIQKEFESERHVLKFLKVLLSPALMGGAVGLGIAQAFQQTAAKAEHEHIAYEVSASGTFSSYPLVQWKRIVPSVENPGDFEEVMEPFVMVCLEAEALVELLVGACGQGMTRSWTICAQAIVSM